MGLARQLLLAASTNEWLRDRAVRSRVVLRSVARFMPGERVDEALEAAARLNGQGIGAILTYLGENVATEEEAESVTRHYLGLVTRRAVSDIDAHVSVKLTQLGLDLDRDLCRRNLERIVDRAGERQRFVWIDMENAPYVDVTLNLFRAMRERSARVGVALQAYLRRTEQDLESLLPLGAALRLVKGAYLEPTAVALARKADVDANYFRLAVRMLDAPVRPGSLVHLATHDRVLIERLAAHVEARKIDPSYYEYAMLYGIQTPLQQLLVRAGRRVRVLIWYGERWFPWYMRRLAERPANVWFVMKNLWST